MIALQVGPDIRSAVVASPAYFAEHPIPNTPQDLARHRCINYRLATAGGIYAWEFEEVGRSFHVRVDGSLVFNDGDMILTAVLAGQGIGYVYEEQIADHVAEGRLIQVLKEWCPIFPGCYLYHPSRRQIPPALAALIDVLRVKSASR